MIKILKSLQGYPGQREINSNFLNAVKVSLSSVIHVSCWRVSVCCLYLPSCRFWDTTTPSVCPASDVLLIMSTSVCAACVVMELFNKEPAAHDQPE